MIQLTDICTPKQWKTLSTSVLKKTGYPVYGANGIIGYWNEYNHEKPTILITCRGATCGSVHLSNPYSYINGNAMCLDDLSDNYDVEFLFYYLQWYDFSHVITGSAQPQITRQNLSKVHVPLLDKTRQKVVVHRLKKIMQALNNRYQSLSILDTLVKSRFIEMFGNPNLDNVLYEKKAIEDICDSIYGGGTPSKSHKEYYTGDIPWITPKDMKTLSINDSQDHITTEAIKNSTTKIIPPKSVLMVIRSGILKHTLPIAINNVAVTINQDMKAFLPSKIIMPEYLLYTFRMLESSILSKVRAVTADNIEFGELRKRQIPVPPIALQNQFADFVQLTDKSKFAVQRSIDTLQTLKAKLMQEYFG